MKCPKCGTELSKNAKFCKKCGTVIAVKKSSDKRDESRYEDMTFHRPKAPARPRLQTPVAPLPSIAPINAAAPVTRDRRADFDNMTARINATPVAASTPIPANQPPQAAAHTAPEAPKKNRTVLITVIVALVLAIAAAVGIFFFLNHGGKKDDKEQPEESVAQTAAEEPTDPDFTPPANIYTIAPNAEDPSTQDLQFTYDEGGINIATCTYMASEKRYILSYSYDDEACKVTITATNNGNTVAVKEIAYSSVPVSNVFETVDGYYVRLDEAKAGKKAGANGKLSDDGPTKETMAPEATSAETNWQELYMKEIITNGDTAKEYQSATLILLDDDDTPELVLRSDDDTKGAMVCRIADGNKVISGTTDPETIFMYTQRSGKFYIQANTGEEAWYTFKENGITKTTSADIAETTLENGYTIGDDPSEIIDYFKSWK